jgi:hypothetical protein
LNAIVRRWVLGDGYGQFYEWRHIGEAAKGIGFGPRWKQVISDVSSRGGIGRDYGSADAGITQIDLA